MRAWLTVGLMLVACLGFAQTDPWRPVESLFGVKGERAKDGSTYKVTFLRTDAQIQNSMGMLIPPEMGLNSYAAFIGKPDNATVVGDTCMLRDEIDHVIDALRAGGIEIVALHNHMAGETPALYFLHFQGHGQAEKLAATIKKDFH